jgi:hypothetical protein
MPKPRSPRSLEIPFIFEQVKPGNILNIGGKEGGAWKWKLCDKQPMTIVDIRRLDKKHRNLTFYHKDIRKCSKDNIGLYDNIILMSTLEHISLPPFSPNHDNMKSWDKCPREEQLKVFQHCMTLLKPNGRMIFTVPCGIPTAHPVTKLHYNKEMLDGIKKGYKVLVERYYKRPQTEWAKCDQLPGPSFFNHQEEKRMQEVNAITRGLVLITLTNK